MHLFKKIFLYFFLTALFISCSKKNIVDIHGVNNLNTKLVNLKINKNNKNDVLKILGPSIIISNDKKIWTYFEVRKKRNLFGKIILQRNNVAIISFNTYGIIDKIIFLDKNNMNKLEFDQNYIKTIGVKDTLMKNILNSSRKRLSNKSKSLKSNEQ